MGKKVKETELNSIQKLFGSVLSLTVLHVFIAVGLLVGYDHLAIVLLIINVLLSIAVYFARCRLKQQQALSEVFKNV